MAGSVGMPVSGKPKLVFVCRVHQPDLNMRNSFLWEGHVLRPLLLESWHRGLDQPLDLPEAGFYSLAFCFYQGT